MTFESDLQDPVLATPLPLCCPLVCSLCLPFASVSSFSLLSAPGTLPFSRSVLPALQVSPPLKELGPWLYHSLHSDISTCAFCWLSCVSALSLTKLLFFAFNLTPHPSWVCIGEDCLCAGPQSVQHAACARMGHSHPRVTILFIWFLFQGEENLKTSICTFLSVLSHLDIIAQNIPEKASLNFKKGLNFTIKIQFQYLCYFFKKRRVFLLVLEISSLPFHYPSIVHTHLDTNAH